MAHHCTLLLSQLLLLAVPAAPLLLDLHVQCTSSSCLVQSALTDLIQQYPISLVQEWHYYQGAGGVRRDKLTDVTESRTFSYRVPVLTQLYRESLA